MRAAAVINTILPLLALVSLAASKRHDHTGGYYRKSGSKKKPRTVALLTGDKPLKPFKGLELSLESVSEVTCPEGAICIQAVQTIASIRVSENGEETTLRLSTLNPQSLTTPVLGYLLELQNIDRIDPSPPSKKNGKKKVVTKPLPPVYVVTLVVTPPTKARAALLKAERKWQATTDGLSYSFVLQRSCRCDPDSRRPATLIVDKNDAIVSGIYVEEPVVPVVADYLGTIYITIERLFGLIESSLVNGAAAAVVVEYDATYGYPTSIFIDPDAAIADEEINYTISDVKVDKPEEEEEEEEEDDEDEDSEDGEEEGDHP